MAKHNILGRKGEQEAVSYLQREGYRVLQQNWRFQRIEIDIIAENSEYIIFIEVKTRTSDRWGNPEDAVNNHKIRRMVEAADSYIRDNNVELPVRFDIISLLPDNKSFIVDHIEDAFYPPVN